MRIARPIATFAAVAAAAAIAVAPAHADPVVPVAPAAPAAPAPAAAAQAAPAATQAVAAQSPAVSAAVSQASQNPALAQVAQNPAVAQAVAQASQNPAIAQVAGGQDPSALLTQLSQNPEFQKIVASGKLPTTDVATLIKMFSSSAQTSQPAATSDEPLAFPVTGKIGDAFKADGGLARYGQPTGTEKSLAGGWKQQEFTDGTIFWNAKVNGGKAAGVGGDIAKAWQKAGGAKGPLGYPVMSEMQIGNPVVGAYNDFQHGSIYWSPQHGAHVVTGKVRDQFVAKGGANGLGYPVSDQKKIAGGLEQQFDKGTVTIKG
ncbi:hypothetical protein P0W64_01690 [Tsukamurella sp. 8F]|uniref:LGFP repeat-containing protein n=1 Tax=unclassified Tsukamurella TaxID=2633480 RepID=UPI0023B89D03|nr:MULTISPECIES: hypothetical protein [unclassified Tsukamurella]MDF0531049.1 hypothetical protein [Tsukamurella sp. 8J]MDF0585484.1 hypothetical protein [Tsukamurella sp. 8F]